MHSERQQRLPFDDELDPEQLRVVFADAEGELVIGGLAGTGKTAAALHRAAYLCKISPLSKGSAVLFLCFNKALAATVRKLLLTFSTNIQGRIEVRNIDKWCWSHFDDTNKQRKVVNSDKQRVEIVYQAMREVQRAGGEHAVFHREPYWFLGEIRLIKGCGYTQLQQYVEHQTAAGSKLGIDALQVIFQVAGAYDALLWNTGRIDFDDYANIVLRKRDSQADPKQYEHVIVDEAQDLSASQLEHVRNLARRSLTLIADTQQAIYNFRRRADSLPPSGAYDAVLKTNHRSSADIVDLSGRLLQGSAQAGVPQRTGNTPLYRRFRFVEDEAAFIAEQVQRLLRSGIVDTEIAVLYNLKQVDRPIRQVFKAAGIEIAIMDNGKLIAPGIHLTTIYQAKGGEFDAVFVPGLVEGVLPRLRPEMDSVAQELELALSRRLLGVAMTRARRYLFLSSAEGRPSRYMYDLGLEPAQTLVA